MSEGFRDVGPYTGELAVERFADPNVYRLRLTDRVAPVGACEGVWWFLKNDDEDPAPVVIEVIDSSGNVVHRKESGATCR